MCGHFNLAVQLLIETVFSLITAAADGNNNNNNNNNNKVY
jgi:hypothetical protein